MAFTSDEATHNEKWVKTDYPHEEGLEFGTTKRSEDSAYLEPEEKSLVKKNDKVGIY